MAKMKKPTQPSLPFPPAADELHREGSWLRIPLRKEWRDVTNKPEEKTKRTTNLASFNSKEVAGLPVHDVPIKQQEILLSGLNSQVAAANTNRTEAATLRQSAWTAFESALFTAGEAAP